MRKMLTSKYTSFIVWLLTITTTVLSLPVEALAYQSPQERQRAKTEKQRLAKEEALKARLAVDVRQLTAAEMRDILGRGPYRNTYLAGTMPWHRSFRDVNLCTGNLFKSFTDIQVSPGKGAGLVLQRTYSSNDEREGPFGRGWTHAYDIRMEEAYEIADDIKLCDGQTPIDEMDRMIRTDFFGGKHVYKRDADGLYTPPVYSHDEVASDYAQVGSNPDYPVADTQTGMDGTVKTFGLINGARMCTSIVDRHGNTTTLTYDDPLNVGHDYLVRVEDPSGRYLYFVWANEGTAQDPHYRITDVVFSVTDTQVPVVDYDDVPGPLQRVHYTYYAGIEAESGYEPATLKSVTVYPGGTEPDRTTTYTYQAVSGETGLLQTITDPVGNAVRYDHAIDTVVTHYVAVYAITERYGSPGALTYTINRHIGWGESWWTCPPHTIPAASAVVHVPDYDVNHHTIIGVGFDNSLRASVVYSDGSNASGYLIPHYYEVLYDTRTNNVLTTAETVDGEWKDRYGSVYWIPPKVDTYTYTCFGNVDSHTSVGFGTEYTSYYNQDKLFQKASFTDMRGKTTRFDYYSATDVIPGNRGNLKSVYDAAHDPGIDSQGNILPNQLPHFEYTYDQTTGQKLTETNPGNQSKPTGIRTSFYYGDEWGNLTTVVQDDAGANPLNRTTRMEYDEFGRVTKRWDPNHVAQYPTSGYAETVYNGVGQPRSVTFPDGEQIEYTYGNNGRLLQVTTTRGNTVTETAMTYEEPGCDLVSSVSDDSSGQNLTIHYDYTPLGTLAQKTMPDGSYFSYEYDWWNNLWVHCGTLSGGDPNSYREPLQEVYYCPAGGTPELISKRAEYDITSPYYEPTAKGDSSFNFRKDGQGNIVQYCTTQNFLEVASASFGGECTGVIVTSGRVKEVINTLHRKIDGNWVRTGLPPFFGPVTE